MSIKQFQRHNVLIRATPAVSPLLAWKSGTPSTLKRGSEVLTARMRVLMYVLVYRLLGGKTLNIMMATPALVEGKVYTHTNVRICQFSMFWIRKHKP